MNSLNKIEKQIQLLWKWLTRNVFSHWKNFVIKKLKNNDYINQPHYNSNWKELEIYKDFDKLWISKILWKINLIKSNNEFIIMEKLIPLDIFEEKEWFKSLLELWKINLWNNDILELLDFKDSYSWDKPFLFIEFIDIFLSQKISINSNELLKFREILFEESKRSYDFYWSAFYDISLWNIWLDKNKNIKFLDFWY